MRLCSTALLFRLQLLWMHVICQRLLPVLRQHCMLLQLRRQRLQSWRLLVYMPLLRLPHLGQGWHVVHSALDMRFRPLLQLGPMLRPLRVLR